MRVFLVLLATAAAAAAGPIEDARERMRKGDVALATRGIETLVAADSAEAVKALHQGIEAVQARFEREAVAYVKKTEEWARSLKKASEISNKIVELLTARKVGTAEYDDLVKKRDDLDVKNQRILAERAEIGARMAASEAIVLAALAAFRRFRAEGAVAAIEALAAGKAGRVSRACTGAIACIGAARSLPALAKLSRSRDAEQRILAVRGLRGPEGGLPPEIAPCLADKAWQVRYAAYEAAGRAAAPVAIPLLIEARAKAPPEDAPRIDLCLWRLTGLQFPEPARWSAWWSESGDAVRGGTFRKPADGPPGPPEDPTAVALASRRLSLLVSAEVETRDASGKFVTDPPNLFDPAREEAKRAVAGIPDGVTFGIIVAGHEPWSPGRASDASRRSAAAWLDGLKERQFGRLLRTLTGVLLEHPERLEHADTVLLVAASNTKADPAEVDVFVASLGELASLPAIHCVAAGDSWDDYLLASLALRTGGGFADGETRVYAKVPAPGADRWTAGDVRLAAYRALRAGQEEQKALEALASIGEEAYPLLPMVVARLESDARLEALAVLSAMGPWAREALPKVQSLAGDSSPEVSTAARDAAERIAGK